MKVELTYNLPSGKHYYGARQSGKPNKVIRLIKKLPNSSNIPMKLFSSLILLLTLSIDLRAGGSLQNGFVTPIGLAGNDIVYDSTRDVLYLSVPSAAGFPYGNSIVTINPTNGAIVHTTFIGSEPNKLAISSDASRVYVGVNGADSFCWWEPATDTVSALVSFTSQFPFGPYTATDFAISPNDPHTVVVSKDDVASSAAGDLELFHDDSSLQDLHLIYGAESICFSDTNDLIGYNSYTTGYDLWKWAFNGTNLTQTQDVGNVISGFSTRIKTSNGLIFADNGKVVAASTLSALGTFSGLPGGAAVEPMPGVKTVYFLGVSGAGYMQMVSFDRGTFLAIDSKIFTNIMNASIRSLVAAGKDPSGGDRLGFTQYGGMAGIISFPPPVFKIQTFLSNGSISQLTWSSDIGRQYQLQWSSDLRNWTTFITTTTTQFSTTKTFNSLGTAGREFYRIVGN
jgi:hypothetical protein